MVLGCVKGVISDFGEKYSNFSNCVCGAAGCRRGWREYLPGAKRHPSQVMAYLKSRNLKVRPAATPPLCCCLFSLHFFQFGCYFVRILCFDVAIRYFRLRLTTSSVSPAPVTLQWIDKHWRVHVHRISTCCILYISISHCSFYTQVAQYASCEQQKEG